VPPKDSTLRFSRYQHGGGVVGNVPAGALTVLKSSIPYVARVNNRQAAVGGRDAQSLEDARLRAPQILRTRTRAVTAEDYEYLAGEVVGVARARCIGAGAQPGDPADPRPGQVVVVVLPDVDTPQGHIPPERLALAADLRATVLAYLDQRRPLGIALDVRPAQCAFVSVQAKLRLPENSNPALVADVRQRAEAELYRYLNPYVGGPRGDGWPFGRDLHVSEIYGLLQRVPAVEFVDELQVSVGDPGGAATAAPTRLTIPPHGLICSNQHRVSVNMEAL
jgi:predicted phage baseplate assembly protein